MSYIISPKNIFFLLSWNSYRRFLIKTSFKLISYSFTEIYTITDILGSIDKKIEINKKKIEKLEAITSLAYNHLFFRKKTNGKLADILIEQVKSDIQVGEAKNISGKYPYFTSGESILSWNKPLVSGRNCFLNTGGNADVKFYVGDAAYSTDTWCISSISDLTDYLYLLLNTIKTELDKKYFWGTGLKHLQKDLLKNRQIYIPAEREILDFNMVVSPSLTTISILKQENQQLVKHRNFILPLLMNGQVVVR